jgi:acyl phosphate:glycerol-3-phosphate acyltransferase
MDLGGYVAVAAFAYLLGSIPSGYVVARAKGIDIRAMGSGNIGATNAFRVLGRGAGIGVLLADGLKGWLAVAVLPQLTLLLFGIPVRNAVIEYHQIVAGLCVVLGHNYTCWLKFKGGKGIATSAGVLAALVPWALLIILTIWIIVFAWSRYVSLGSIAASFALPFATWLTNGSPLLIGVTAAMGALAIFKHRGNIERLLKGTESRFRLSKEKPS